MLKWIIEILFSKKIDELESMKNQLLKLMEEAKESKNLALRVNTMAINIHDVNSPAFKSEVSAIWKSSEFQFLMHLTRNELIAELVNGGDTASKNVAGMLKGLEALARKMQSISISAGAQ